MFYAAIGAGALLAIGIATALILAYLTRNMIIAYTDSNPAAMPAAAERTAVELEDLEKRLEDFRKSVVESKDELPELILSADDINALLRKTEEGARVKEMLHVFIEGDKIGAQVSVPLGELGVPLASGRYLNGTAAFKVSMRDGVLIVTAESMTVKGAPLPEAIMTPLRNENFAKNVYRRPQNAEMLRKIESIEIKDGRISITPRANR